MLQAIRVLASGNPRADSVTLSHDILKYIRDGVMPTLPSVTRGDLLQVFRRENPTVSLLSPVKIEPGLESGLVIDRSSSTWDGLPMDIVAVERNNVTDVDTVAYDVDNCTQTRVHHSDIIEYILMKPNGVFGTIQLLTNVYHHTIAYYREPDQKSGCEPDQVLFIDGTADSPITTQLQYDFGGLFSEYVYVCCTGQTISRRAEPVEIVTARKTPVIRLINGSKIAVKPKCPHGNAKSSCIDCRGTSICKHDCNRYRCDICAVKYQCEHGKSKRNCAICLSCQHGVIKRDCAICSPCPHGVVMSRCMFCSGCSHGKLKRNCVKCNACPHGKSRRGCKLCSQCEHGKIKYDCAVCSPCAHGKSKRNCMKCSGCPHEKSKRGCEICSGCDHGKAKYNCNICSQCEHGNHKRRCVGCVGCPHGRLKHNCDVCSQCEHGSHKQRCKICHPCVHGGNRGDCVKCHRCEHGRQKYHCGACKGECGGVPPKPKTAPKSAPCTKDASCQCRRCQRCIHGNIAYGCVRCKQCPHGIHKARCATCSPCDHLSNKYSCATCMRIRSQCIHGVDKTSCEACLPRKRAAGDVVGDVNVMPAKKIKLEEYV